MFGFLYIMLNALPDVTMIKFQQVFLFGGNGNQTQGLTHARHMLHLQHQFYPFNSNNYVMILTHDSLRQFFLGLLIKGPTWVETAIF